MHEGIRSTDRSVSFVPSYVPSSNFDEFGERFLPGVHLDDLNTRHYLVHQPHPLVRPHCDFLPQFSDKFTQIGCNKPVSYLYSLLYDNLIFQHPVALRINL
jgi:hypothetical protein